jgi:hypothetical protein
MWHPSVNIIKRSDNTSYLVGRPCHSGFTGPYTLGGLALELGWLVRVWRHGLSLLGRRERHGMETS